VIRSDWLIDWSGDVVLPIIIIIISRPRAVPLRFVLSVITRHWTKLSLGMVTIHFEVLLATCRASGDGGKPAHLDESKDTARADLL
jgi:hypothetical protein